MASQTPPNSVAEPSSPPNFEKLALSVPEAIEAANTSRGSIYRAINAGELVARKRGRRTVVLVDDLRRWLKNLKPYRSP